MSGSDLVLDGAALGVVCAWLARALGPRGGRLALAWGLVAAALVYVGFAAARGATPAWLGVEAAGVVPFAALAAAGVRRSPWYLAAGWALHALWDRPLHAHPEALAFVPAWYPPLCLGFDLGVAAALALAARRGEAAPAPPAEA